MYTSARVSKMRAKLHPPNNKQTKKTTKKLHPPIHSPNLEPRLPQGRVFFCSLPNPSAMNRARPLPALQKQSTVHSFIVPAERRGQREGRHCSSLPPPSGPLSAPRAAAHAPDSPAARGLPGLPFPRRKERARGPGNPGPLPVGSGQAGRPRPPRPAACARGRRGGEAGPGRGEPRPRSPAPPPERPRRREG